MDIREVENPYFTYFSLKPRLLSCRFKGQDSIPMRALLMIGAIALSVIAFQLLYGNFFTGSEEQVVEEQPSLEQDLAPKVSSGPLAEIERLLDSKAVPVAWPPRLGKLYPDLTLTNRNGQLVQLSSFKGNVLLIEMIGMNCPACQAFSGGNRKGGYQGIAPQANLPSIQEILAETVPGLALGKGKLVLIQILLYDMQMHAPGQADAAAWARHFGLDPERAEHVLAGGPELIGPSSYAMIPGFQLVDQNFVLRMDSTGHSPKHSLEGELIPFAARLVKKEGGLPKDQKIESSQSEHKASASWSCSPAAESSAAAYSAVPHSQTTYQSSQSSQPVDLAASIQCVLGLVDWLIIQKVRTQQAFQARSNVAQALSSYEDSADKIIARLETYAADPRLQKPVSLIIMGVEGQTDYFRVWARSGADPKLAPGGPDFGSNNHIRRSSESLKKAYSELMAAFAGESEHNKRAFFDHLCALDFV